MFEWLFGKKNKEWVGIDLGASAIKVVEIKKTAERLVLVNYALLETPQLRSGQATQQSSLHMARDKSGQAADGGNIPPAPPAVAGQALQRGENSSPPLGGVRGDVDFSHSGQTGLSNEEIAANLKMLFERAGIKSRRVNISLPIGKTFSTIVEFPWMNDTELAAAVPFEARKYIPVPMEDVALDWSIIGQAPQQSSGQAAEQESGSLEPLNEVRGKPRSINADGGTQGLPLRGSPQGQSLQTNLSSSISTAPSQQDVGQGGAEHPPSPPSKRGKNMAVYRQSSSLALPRQGSRDTARDKSGSSTLQLSSLDTVSSTGGPSTALGADAPKARLQVLLVAVPKEIIDKLTEIAALAGLQINSMEQEAFSLARSLVGNDKNTFLVVDIGRKSSDIVVVDGGFVRLSHNFESVNKEVLLMEIDRLVNVFKVKYNKNIGACLLTGGRAQEKELFEFLTAKLRLPTALGNPFARLEFPPALEPALRELGSMLSVAAGLAMRES